MAGEKISKVKEVITNDFLQNVLQKSEKDTSIIVNNIIFKEATNKGDNYSSDMFRAMIDYDYKKGTKKISGKKSVIIKFQLIVEGKSKDLLSEMDVFKIESCMMGDTLPKMNKFLGSGQKLCGDLLYYGENPDFLIIEDLSTQNFCMADRQNGLDIKHSLLAIRNLAKFHASSVKLCELEPEKKKFYSKGIFHAEHSQENATFFSTSTKQLGTEVANWPEVDLSMSEKLIKLADNIYQKACEATACNENEFNVVNHGDFWVNNMLFKYDDQKQPIEHIFVDFQLPVYTSPVIDILYFFNLSLTDDMLDKYEDLLLEEYIKVLVSTMAKLDCHVKPPTISELKNMMLKRAFFGVAVSLTILPFILVDKSEAIRLDEMISEDGSLMNNQKYYGGSFRVALARRLKKFEKLGLLK